jgi:hypothetical protein
MTSMNAQDLEARYGPLVTIDALAEYFHARPRQIFGLLRRERVPVFDVGDAPMAPIRLLEQRLGLEPIADEHDVDAVAHRQAQWRATHNDAGEPKPAADYLAELRAKTPALLARLDAARTGKGELVASRR